MRSSLQATKRAGATCPLLLQARAGARRSCTQRDVAVAAVHKRSAVAGVQSAVLAALQPHAAGLQRLQRARHQQRLASRDLPRQDALVQPRRRLLVMWEAVAVGVMSVMRRDKTHRTLPQAAYRCSSALLASLATQASERCRA